MLRGKIYSYTDEKTYSVSFIDYRNKKLIVISNGQKNGQEKDAGSSA